MPVSIRNNNNRLDTYTLASDALRDAGPPYGYIAQTAGMTDRSVNAAGESKTFVRAVRKVLPASLSFLPGEVKHNLPSAILTCPEVAAAITERKLVVTAQSDDPANNQSSPAPTSIAVDKTAIEPV